MTDTNPTPTEGQHPLVGKFFHTTGRCAHGARVAQWQGHIVAAVTADVLLVELFDWLMGERRGQQLITLADFMARNPILYDDGEDMRFSYEHGAVSHTKRCDIDCGRPVDTEEVGA